MIPMTHSKHWLGLGALLLTAALFARLGFWQLSRAQEHREIEERFAAADNMPVLDWPVSADFDAVQYRKLRLAGSYEPDRHILLDNMTEAGQVGYQVLTPFVLAGGSAVLVNRGWLPADADRSRLPDVDFVPAAETVVGRIDRLPRAALQFAATPVTTGKVTVMSFPTIDEIEAVVERELADFQLLLEQTEADGFLRHWEPASDRDDRSLGYAVQWFGLMALALVLSVGVQWRRLRSSGEKS